MAPCPPRPRPCLPHVWAGSAPIPHRPRRCPAGLNTASADLPQVPSPQTAIGKPARPRRSRWGCSPMSARMVSPMWRSRARIFPYPCRREAGMLEDLKARVAAESAARGGKARRIALTDSTFRDGQQCLWATRMRTEHMLPAAPLFDAAGFDTLETIAIVQFDGAVIYLREDPFERIRLLRERIRRTPMRGALRSNLLHGFAPLGFDISELFLECQLRAGLREIAFLESLHAWEIIAPGVRKAKELGATTTVAVLYNDAPGYDAAYYESVARDAVTLMTPDRIMFADAGGTMTLEKLREIIPAVRRGMGPEVRLEFNTHC
ncbi:MAG TPA: hypothetical protein ENJ52_15450, partial [Aliiroseovarius sp.]|nr:hypothetical protein [Aliiroseovarius sp.]